MASANTDSWSRDEVADANPDLPRKRPRSEEAEVSPAPTDDSILVEALPAEIEGSSYDNAIELHDDATMASYSSTFSLAPDMLEDANGQIMYALLQIEKQQAIDVGWFGELAIWIRDHVERTRRAGEIWDAGFEEDADFFGKLGRLCFALLDCDYDFVDSVNLDVEDTAIVAERVDEFLPLLVELSTRILVRLPDMLDCTLGRRDSGITPKTRHSVDLLSYIQVLAQILAHHRCSGLAYLKDCFQVKPVKLKKTLGARFIQQPSAVRALPPLLQKLASGHQEISNAWDAIDAALRIPLSHGLDALDPPEQVMGTLHSLILPVICGKHPRALPNGFHTLAIETGTAILGQLIRLEARQDTQISRLYNVYISSDYDALLPEPHAGTPAATTLRDMSGSRDDVLADLMSIAWLLQGLRSFIYSDIMDVRSCGIDLLTKQLHRLHNDYHRAEHLEHPVLQYVSRFMRANELTKYIFGPDSHASIVNHSTEIIGFLAATSAYTDLETDIIWHACTNSVEAEFVKASFRVLCQVYQYLPLEHLLYLANKYTTTPPAKLGKDAVDSLTALFQRVQSLNLRSDQDLHRLATAFISIDIMMRVDAAEDNSSLLRLRDIARNELNGFCGPCFSTDDRLEIYRRCIPDLLNTNERSSTSADILLQFLRAPPNADESKLLLGMLPVAAAVRELQTFIESKQITNAMQPQAVLSAIEVRMEVIVRLMSLPGAEEDEHTTRIFFRHTVGDCALSNECRNLAWRILMAMATVHSITQTAAALVQHFLSNEIIDLPIDFVTPELINLLGHALSRDASQQACQEDYTLLLETPTFAKLVEAAETSCATRVSQLAQHHICQLIFDYPRTLKARPAVIKCQSTFTKQVIQRICTAFSKPVDSNSSPVCQMIALLESLHKRSCDTAASYLDDSTSTIVLDSEPSEDLLQTRLEIYNGGNPHRKVLHLQATPRTPVYRLVAELPSITGAAENRLIVRGKPLDLVADSTSSFGDIGLQTSGVISVCPRHTAESDIDLILARSNAVEREIIVNYDKLELLLDGPEDVASRLYTFITKIRPPSHARRRVLSSESTVYELFPAEAASRCAFTLFVLRAHLVDFASLGVADEKFLCQGIQLLVAMLCDDSRSFRPEVVVQAMECLTAFLQERPAMPTIDTLFDDPTQFVSRMIDHCFSAMQSSHTKAGLRCQLLSFTLRALLQAFRLQTSTWQSFVNDERVVELHSEMFFDADRALSTTAILTISNLCTDTAAAVQVAEFYTKIVLALVPQALMKPGHATLFFTLAVEVLLANRSLESNENRARCIVESLLSTLWEYQHCESVDLPVVDPSMLGLLKLLTQSILILKCSKKPHQLGELATKVIGTLLFPPYKALDSRPLVDPQTRQAAFRLAHVVCESVEDLEGVLDLTSVALRDSVKEPHAKYPGQQGWLRPAFKCSGLLNLGMTCYMNSLLQQLFANVHFRKFILQVEILDEQQQLFLLEVQKLFAYMQDHYDTAADTMPLAKVLNIQTDSQEDVHGFYEDFLSRLEANMPTPAAKAALMSHYTGQLITQIKGECGHVSPRTEPFVDLPVIVKNKACLAESLDEFVQGEPMEGANKYKCATCDPAEGGRLVNAMRRACPEQIPDNLTFCLKRFTFEAMLGMDGKVNDRFEFPQTIDMSQYQRNRLENPDAEPEEDKFELVGVIVHQGTLQIGHYWSYVLLRNTSEPSSRTWVKLEDRIATFVQNGIEDVQRECFGGQRYTNGNERVDNAYVLFYQRKHHIEEKVAIADEVHNAEGSWPLPPKVPIPVILRQTIHEGNAWRFRIAHLFDETFVKHLDWLSSECQESHATHTTDSDVSDVKLHFEGAASQQTDLLPKLSHTLMVYTQRIAICAPVPAQRLESCVTSLIGLARARSSCAQQLLQAVENDPTWFHGVLLHSEKAVRTWLNKLILACLASLQESELALYEPMYQGLLRMHAEVMKQPAHAQRLDWEDYLHLPLELGKAGPSETATVLDLGYWAWTSELLNVPFSQAIRKKYSVGLYDHFRSQPSKVSALYGFLHGILNAHVDPNDIDPAKDIVALSRHIVTESGVLLHRHDLEVLIKERNMQQGKSVLMWMQCARWTDPQIATWSTSTPGKLLGLLLSRSSDSNLHMPIERYLVDYIDLEEGSLEMILAFVLHFYSNCRDSDMSRRVFRALLNVQPLWEGSAGQFLTVFSELYTLAPFAMVRDLEGWINRFVVHKNMSVRDNTSKWLQAQVFSPSSVMSETEEFETMRCWQARKFAQFGCETLQNAYNQERSRDRYEALIVSTTAVGRYLKTLKQRISAIKEDAEGAPAQLPAGLYVEMDEVPKTLEAIARLEGEILAHWTVSEPVSPLVYAHVRASVEVDDEGMGSSDDDDEDDESLAGGR